MSEEANRLEQVKQLIQEEDFDFLIQRLVKEKKWTHSEAKEACQYYKNFLYLKLKYGQEYILPPSIDIDEVWHNHILFTQEYSAFCERVFGKFLHHNPGVDGGDLNYQELFEKNTQKFYKQEFGDIISVIKFSFVLFFKIVVKNFITKIQDITNKPFLNFKNN